MLDIRDVRVVYPNGFEAVRRASLRVGRGEIVALIGRSGAGKSTLLRAINGLQPIASGSVHLDGVEVSRLRGSELAALRCRVGFIWQEHNVVSRLSVFKNVLTGRLGHSKGIGTLFHLFGRHDREIALRSLDRVSLAERATSRADRLSGGERQRVAIARALAQEPRVLLADEPVASLDAELARQVMTDLVRVARDEGVPTLITLHDVVLARTFCDRIVGLARGATVFEGGPAELDDAALGRIYRAGSEAVGSVA
jgi:phosphonate transport system ATP-binding protein